MDIIINSASPPIVTGTIPSHSGLVSDISNAVRTKVQSSAPNLTTVVSSLSPAAANIKQAVTELNDHVQSLQRTLEFSADNGLMVVRVVDTQTNKVISQMPTQAALDLAKSINQDQSFHIFSSKA